MKPQRKNEKTMFYIELLKPINMKEKENRTSRPT